VLSSDNYAENPYFEAGWFSMDVTGAGTTNGLIWLGQAGAADGAGIWNWNLINGVADPTNATGNQAVATGGSLSVAASGGLMVDTNFDIFVGQYLTDSGDTNADCMEFTNWNDGLSYGGQAISNGVKWSVSSTNSTFLGVYDTTIDSREQPKYVACALNGGPVTNGIRILDAATGAVVVANLDPTNQYYVTAWDNVGNLYGASGTSHLLRVFSPPGGTNQAALNGTIRVQSAISSIILNGTNLTIKFIGSRSDQAGQFTLQSCDTLNGDFANIPGAVPTQISAGFFTVSAIATNFVQYYRISTTLGQ